MDYKKDISFKFSTLDFNFGDAVFHKGIEKRLLKNVRQTLKDPNAEGPEVLYTIAMDIGNIEDQQKLENSNLLYGACIYNKGTIGNEPVRSQGHVHAVSDSCHSSTGELYEIWYGEAIIYMQEYVDDNPGRVFAVEAKQGDIVLVPPNWAHYTVNKNPSEYMAFGAWCIRDYGFDYNDLRARKGLAHYPIIKDSEIHFTQNNAYHKTTVIRKKPRRYSEFGLMDNISIYEQYQQNNSLFNFITDPKQYNDIWINFIP